jgi:tetraacyldisaccharide 4'-kinase
MNPLSMLFGAGVGLRNALYDRGIFRTKRLVRPVISVGNISVGGSGKTPFVIALGQLLKQRGIAFDVLSRGYGRSSNEIAVVDPRGAPSQFGDEPLLIARTLQAPVIVGADRYKAGLLAEKKFDSRLHLLDDGFQHRRLHRDFDIVLLPEKDLHETLLPAGRLREPLSALQRSDAVVLFEPGQLPSTWKGELFKARRIIALGQIGGRAIAFCAVARPRQFFNGVNTHGQQLAEKVAFPDHHRYNRSDIGRLLRLKQSTGADLFVTTEKDLINLGPLAAQLEPLRVAELRIELEAAEHTLNVILEATGRRTGCKV